MAEGLFGQQEEEPTTPPHEDELFMGTARGMSAAAERERKLREKGRTESLLPPQDPIEKPKLTQPEDGTGKVVLDTEYEPDKDVVLGAHRGSTAKQLHRMLNTSVSGTGGYMTVPDTEEEDPMEVRDVINFVIGDEMGILGMKWDENEFSFELDNAINQWSEHPVMSSIALAGMLFPIVAGIRKSSKVGALGIRSGKGLIKSADHATEVRRIAEDPIYKAVDRNGNPLKDGHSFLDDETVLSIKTATPEDIEKLVSRRELKTGLLGWEANAKSAAIRQEVTDAIVTGKYNELPLGTRASAKFQSMFGNDYIKSVTAPNSDNIRGWDAIMKQMNTSNVFNSFPAASLGKDVYKYLIGATDAAGIKAIKGLNTRQADEAIAWADAMKVEMRATLEDGYKSGFISKKTYDMMHDQFDGVHLPALKHDTEGVFTFDDRVLSSMNKNMQTFGGRKLKGLMEGTKGRGIAALRGATLKGRFANITREKVVENLDAGTLITDPAEFTLAGIVRDRYHQESFKFVRDAFSDFITKGPDSKYNPLMMTKGQLAESDLPQWLINKQWKSVDDLPDHVGKRLRRMLGKSLDDIDMAQADLPMIHRDLFDEFFGEFGLFEQGSAASGLLDFLTAVHKTAKTALNLATHGQNLGGNLLGFLPMAGFRWWGKQGLEDASLLSSGFKKIAGEHLSKGTPLDELFQASNLERIFEGATIKARAGHEIKISEFFSEPAMRTLFETSAFESVEGYSHVRKIFGQLKSMESRGELSGGMNSVSLQLAKVLSAGVGGAASLPGAKQVLDVSSSLYLAEDMIPKMMYALDLRRKGMSTPAVVTEVARRLPMYGTVGTSISSMRRNFLPWITFQAETTRIMKNNMQDYPLRAMAMLQMPDMVQALASTAGFAPSYDEIKENVGAMAPWAERPTTVQMNEQSMATGVGGATGAFLGGSVGAAIGGAKGAAVGAIAGGAGMAALGHNFGQTGRDQVRAWALDFLPHSAMMPSSTSPYALDKVRHDYHSVVALSPQEPLSIIAPIFNVMAGQGNFGTEIPHDGLLSQMGKMTMGIIGTMAPPLVQKYGMKIEGPGLSPGMAMADISDNHGGMPWLGNGTVGTLTGVAVSAGVYAGVQKFFGTAPAKAATGLFGKAAQTFGRAPVGIEVGASLAAGGIAGVGATQTNVARLMSDLGMQNDAFSGSPGHPLYDVMFNSVLGLSKSWAVSEENRAINESRKEREYTDLRTVLSSDAYYAALNGRDGDSARALAKAQRTFTKQYADVKVAQEKYKEWALNRMKAMNNNPSMKGISQENQRAGFIKAADLALETRSKAAEERWRLYRTQMQMNQLNRISNTKFELFEDFEKPASLF